MIYTGRQNTFACKDCVERTLGCHDHCEKYAEGKARYAELKNAIEGDRELRAYVKKSIERHTHVETKHKFLRRPKSK